MDTHKETCGPNSHLKYQENSSPESVFNGHKMDYGKIEYNNNTIKKHLNECPEIGVSTSSGCMIEPASDERGDNYTIEFITPTVDNIEVPRLRDQKDEDRNQVFF